MHLIPHSIQTDAFREAMRSQWLADEKSVLQPLLSLADIGDEGRAQAREYAYQLVEKLRAEQRGKGGVDALLNEFSLSTEEGVALMCLAEALLRVPDALTADKLIRDKLQAGNWSAHLGQSNSMFVNASAWALLFTGKMVNYSDAQQLALHGSLQRATGRLGQPVIRKAVKRAMAIMGDVFVMGRTIEAAMQRARAQESRGYRYSYDMLGEGARTAAAAQAYFEAYEKAIQAIGENARADSNPAQSAGISIKLSAIHPRYELAQADRLVVELVPRLKRLCLLAREYDIGLTVDAEEAARLDLSLEIIQRVFADTDLRGWNGFGVAVQAYQKRAPLVIDFLADLARRVKRRIMVRLVKGAYWDSEIKHAQSLGLADYPVFTRKASTDVCYQACARKLLQSRDCLYPQFATHNAWTVSAILQMDETRTGYEFQRLHGMGEALYEKLMRDYGLPCRIYAPVGQHEDLLAYLVRRLLENGANSSFVNNIVDAHVSIDSLVEDPLLQLRQWQEYRNPSIPSPAGLFAGQRLNSAGWDLSDIHFLQDLRERIAALPQPDVCETPSMLVRNPACLGQVLGGLQFDDAQAMNQKLAYAHEIFSEGSEWSGQARAEFLRRLGEGLQVHAAEFIHLCIYEAGKTLADAVAELREAVDFCFYYAERIAELPPGRPLGVVLCISPWNFPLAIFLGQIAGALAAGNVVLAKPAEQTSLIALRALQLMHDCGLPQGRVQCVLGPGPQVGAVLVPDVRIQGVVFTGSMRAARWLYDNLSLRADAPIPLVAETGGQNAMIVDSTALPEQVVDDVIRSGFQSAGQRCSALRVLFLQDDIADKMIAMIRGAMEELCVASPAELSTDLGPLIDAMALARLQAHEDRMRELAGVTLLHQVALPQAGQEAYFFAPTLYEITSLDQLEEEVFGPVVHIIRYAADELDAVIQQVNASGYGLTLGVHTRVDRTADDIAQAVNVGNVYVNRDMIGAVVGVQPFGGHGLSGTGPKAGGPLYVQRLWRPAVSETCDVSAERLQPERLLGPTGEENVYVKEPYGLVQLYYADSDSLQHCLTSLNVALSCGNRVEVYVPPAWQADVEHSISESAASAPSFEVFAVSTDEALQSLQMSACVVCPPKSVLLPELMASVRGRAGGLTRIVSQSVSQTYWHSFVLEKHISTNTTAAGGNATLMTMAP